MTNIDCTPPKFTPPVQGFRSKKTPCKTQEPENHTLFSGTYPYRPNKGVSPRALPITTKKKKKFPLPFYHLPPACTHTHTLLVRLFIE